MKLKTVLYISHRWIGIVISLFFVMWFFSGVVMMYVPYPELTAEERYLSSEVLDPSQIVASPDSILGGNQELFVGDELVITSIASKPVYLLRQYGSRGQAFYTDSGDEVDGFSTKLAVDSARTFYQNLHQGVPEDVLFEKTIDVDQWTISGEFNVHRPLHLVSVIDGAGTILYVSSRTGQVVLDTNRSERVWNWLGSVVHWIYPIQLRKNAGLWINVLITLSMLGLFSIFTGAIIGISRLRIKRPYKNKGVSPYQGMAKYHHILGLVILLFLTTFMFSGLMSIEPWGIFDSKTSYVEQHFNFQARDDFSNSPIAYSNAAELRQILTQNQNRSVKQIDWRWLDGDSYITLQDAPDKVRTSLSLQGSDNLEQQIMNKISELIPDSEILEAQVLNEYDAYYYTRRSVYRPLPVLRVKFNDPESTWFHIDMTTGQLVGRRTFKNRIQRWLFNGLHSLDFGVLLNNRPAWDIVVILLSALGLAFSITSAVISWRRLRKKLA